MANGVGFEGSNDLMYGFGDVRDLEIFRVGGDRPMIISAWRFTPEELEVVKETGIVWVQIMGTGMPPIGISGTALVEVDGRPSRAEPVMPHVPARKEKPDV